MNIAQAIVAAARETEHALVTLGPVTYKVRRLTSMELVDAGAARLFAARPAPTNAPAGNPRDAQKFANEAVCAGVVGAGASADAIEPLSVVMDAAKEDADAGRVWVGSLIPGHATKLYAEILALSTDGGRAAEQVASFLGTAASDAAHGRE